MFNHYTVLLEETIEALNIKPDGIYVDCTLGGGGHSSEILKRLTTGKLYAFDQDQVAIKAATERLLKISNNFEIINSNFENLKAELNSRGVHAVDGIVFDLGVSSPQLDTPERGFSYQYDAKLDMRMDTSSDFSAYELINEYPYEKLVEIFFRYGEEKFSKQIARKIEEARKTKPIETTFELVELIKAGIPAAARRSGGHPAKRVFQAVRIEVNRELLVFEEALEQAIEVIAPKGRIAVITFHSLEDRICKTIFNDYSKVPDLPKGLPIIPKEYQPILKLVNRKVITPSSNELDENNRSRSSKLRVVEKN